MVCSDTVKSVRHRHTAAGKRLPDKALIFYWNRIHPAVIKVDVKSPVIQTAFAEQPPAKFQFSGCRPLIDKKFLYGQSFSQRTAGQIVFFTSGVYQVRNFFVRIWQLFTSVSDNDLTVSLHYSGIKNVGTVAFGKCMKNLLAGFSGIYTGNDDMS